MITEGLYGHSMLKSFLSDLDEMKSKSNDRCKEIIKEWDEAKNLPRKQKKKRRKELEWKYEIFAYAEKALSRFY